VLEDDEVAITPQTCAGIHHPPIRRGKHRISGLATDVPLLRASSNPANTCPLAGQMKPMSSSGPAATGAGAGPALEQKRRWPRCRRRCRRRTRRRRLGRGGHRRRRHGGRSDRPGHHPDSLAAATTAPGASTRST
jgi:hypothetical protein